MANKNTDVDMDAMSAEERTLYDRQLRLWGYECQNKLRAANVLVIGMQGLGAEITKNLILSGIRSITLKDHTDVSIKDRCSQFLILHDSQERNRAKASLNAAQKLNPNVQVIADTTPLDEDLDSLVIGFNLVIATECSPESCQKLNESCRKNKIHLFITDVYGLFGYFYQDINFKYDMHNKVFPINDENYVLPVYNQKLPPYILTFALLKFQNEFNRKPNPDTAEEDLDKLKSIVESVLDQEGVEHAISAAAFEEYYNELVCELSPATSILGALVSQTASNVIMKKPPIHFNVFFYDHIEHSGVFHLL